MFHCTVQYVKPSSKIGTPGLAKMLATAKMPSTAGPQATASSKGTEETLATPIMPARHMRDLKVDGNEK